MVKAVHSLCTPLCVIVRALLLQVFRSLLRQEIGFFDDQKNSTGRLTTRLSTDAGAYDIAPLQSRKSDHNQPQRLCK